MRTIHLGVDLEPKTGGTYRSVLNFLGSLSRLGVDVKICSFSARPPSAAVPNIVRVQTARRLPASAYYFWSGCYTKRLDSLLDRADAVFLHGLFIHPFVHAALWCRRKRVPYAVIPHGSLDPWVFTYRRYRKELWLRLYGRLMLEDSSSVIFASQREKDKATRRWRIPNAEVINWPVPPVPGFDKAGVRHELRLACGLPEKCRIALFCGRIHPMKRPVETIETFLRTAPPDWVLLLVGPHSPEVPEAMITKLCADSAGRCRYMGAVCGERLADFYRAADLLVLMSHRENFSYAVTEALASGVPVVISDGVDLSSDIARESCGFVIDSSADRQTVECELRKCFACEPALLHSMGARGQDWVRRELSEERFRERIGTLCRSITAPPKIALAGRHGLGKAEGRCG